MRMNIVLELNRMRLVKVKLVLDVLIRPRVLQVKPEKKILVTIKL